MTNVPTLRSVIEKELESRDHTLNSFSKCSGINRGTLSAILNGNPPKPISIRQLDLITEALGYPAGYFYPLYVDECLQEEQPNKRRLKAFLIRCAEVGQIECIHKLINQIVDDLSYIPMIFAIGEELYESGFREESRIFYSVVIESEKYQHSERLAISHYRIFRLSIGEDYESNLLAATRFELYLHRLPENYKLEGLMQLISICLSLQKYLQGEIYVDELRKLTDAIYLNYEKAYKASKEFHLNAERPLVVYYGQSFLLKGIMLLYQKRYDEVHQWIARYEDLSWFPGLSDEEKVEVEKFKLYAKLNEFNLKVLLGDRTSIREYFELVKSNPYELLIGLKVIIESANTHDFFVDDILSEVEVSEELYTLEGNYYKPLISRTRYLHLNYQLTVYYFRKNDIRKGIERTLYSLKYAINLNNYTYFMMLVPIFERYRSYASSEELQEYENLLKGVLENAEIDFRINSSVKY